MFHRLMQRTGERGLEFGVKITNTFPVDVAAGELPSDCLLYTSSPSAVVPAQMLHTQNWLHVQTSFDSEKSLSKGS